MEDGVAEELEGLVALVEGGAVLEGAGDVEAVTGGAGGVGLDEGVADGGAALNPALVRQRGREEQLTAEDEANALLELAKLLEIACGQWASLRCESTGLHRTLNQMRSV